jgi:hypothetical protein
MTAMSRAAANKKTKLSGDGMGPLLPSRLGGSFKS